MSALSDDTRSAAPGEHPAPQLAMPIATQIATQVGADADKRTGNRCRYRPGRRPYGAPRQPGSEGTERERLARALASLAMQRRRLERMLFVLMLLVLAAATMAQTVPGGVPAARGVHPGSSAGTASAADTLILPTAPPATGAGAHSPPAGVAASSVQFIGTATVLIRHAGFTILTDPNFLHKGDDAARRRNGAFDRLAEGIDPGRCRVDPATRNAAVECRDCAQRRLHPTAPSGRARWLH